MPRRKGPPETRVHRKAGALFLIFLGKVVMEAEDLIDDPRIPVEVPTNEPTSLVVGRDSPPEPVDPVVVDPTEAIADTIFAARQSYRERIKPVRVDRNDLIAAFRAAQTPRSGADEVAVVLEKVFVRTMRAGGRSIPVEPFKKLPDYDGEKFQEYLADLALDYDLPFRLERGTGGGYFIVWDVPPLLE